MKPYSLKQRAICTIISAIEWAINAKWLSGLFRLVSRLLIRVRVPFGGSGLHVAFIADGNRRFKRKHKDEKPVNSTPARFSEIAETYSCEPGMQKIAELTRYALSSGWSAVSFFCFSIKNFQRDEKEVRGLMDNIRRFQKIDFDFPVKIKIHGNRKMLDDDIQQILGEWEERTSSNTKLVINLFIAYSSTDAEFRRERLKSKVDLVVRTGGVRRLSDFMVYEVASGASFECVQLLWPELTTVHVWLIVIKYLLEERYLNDKKRA